MSSIANNRFGRYMIYAFGEIILVVVGILIALQINSWNGSRLDKKKERRYLTEIRDNMVKDITSLQLAQETNKNKVNSIRFTLEKIGAGLGHDSLLQVFGYHMNTISTYAQFLPQTTAYDNLISSGNIDLISNDSLRKEISEYYRLVKDQSGVQNRVREVTRNFADHITPMLNNAALINLAIGVSMEKVPHAVERLDNNSVLVSNLVLMNVSINYQNRAISRNLINAEGIIGLINQELAP